MPFNLFKNYRRKTEQTQYSTQYDIMQQDFNALHATYVKDLEDSDIVTSCIQPFTSAIGKCKPLYTLKDELAKKTYVEWMLLEPNPYMTMQVLLEKVISDMLLSGNGFVLINRDSNGLPRELLPLSPTRYKLDLNTGIFNCWTLDGKELKTMYSNIIHLRRNVNKSSVFGSAPTEAIRAIVNILNTTDTGLANAVNSSNHIKWLLEMPVGLSEKDVKAKVDTFNDTYLNVQSGTSAAAGVGSGIKATQLKSEPIMPDDKYVKYLLSRLYACFNTNEKIVMRTYGEDEYQAYFDGEIVPILKQLSDEFTRKLFTREERAAGEEITFALDDLMFISLKTKLELSRIVDRGGMTINEWRPSFGLKPTKNASGDEFIRRLDTARVT